MHPRDKETEADTKVPICLTQIDKVRAGHVLNSANHWALWHDWGIEQALRGHWTVSKGVFDVSGIEAMSLSGSFPLLASLRTTSEVFWLISECTVKKAVNQRLPEWHATSTQKWGKMAVFRGLHKRFVRRDLETT